MKLFTSRAARRRAILGLLAVLAVLAAVTIAVRRYASFLLDPAALEAWIEGFGVLSPVVFILVQATQVVVAPIPGQATAVVGGYLFGPYWGTLYSMVGVMLGSAVAFSIAKWYGRPAVERLVHERLLERFDGFVEETGLLGLFVFVAIPGLPDDVVCFVAGLTRFGLGVFLVVMTLGRLPAYLLTNIAGGNLAEGQVVRALVVLAVVVGFSVVAYLNRARIQQTVRGFGDESR
jgi:uncharacterized membrane protein YdjX (TVP38/TMEM64 family)